MSVHPEITPNIPYPARGKYPWRSMGLNDSFLVRDPDISLKHMAALAYGAGRRLGWKFSARKTLDGIRVWRIA
jgi:hypothetical protein